MMTQMSAERKKMLEIQNQAIMSAKISKNKCVASHINATRKKKKKTTFETDGTEMVSFFFCTFQTPIITIHHSFFVARSNQQLTVLLAVRDTGHKLIYATKRNETNLVSVHV